MLTFRVAVWREVRPVALVDPVVVGQARLTGLRLRDPEGTLVVRSGAARRVDREDAEAVRAPRAPDLRDCKEKERTVTRPARRPNGEAAHSR